MTSDTNIQLEATMLTVFYQLIPEKEKKRNSSYKIDVKWLCLLSFDHFKYCKINVYFVAILTFCLLSIAIDYCYIDEKQALRTKF